MSERLGHATVSITLDTYSHAIPAMQEEAAALIAGLVFAEVRPSYGALFDGVPRYPPVSSAKCQHFCRFGISVRDPHNRQAP